MAKQIECPECHFTTGHWSTCSLGNHLREEPTRIEWKRDLLAAGWTEERHTVWKDPEGRLWRGPYGAWCELQRQQQEKLDL